VPILTIATDMKCHIKLHTQSSREILVLLKPFNRNAWSIQIAMTTATLASIDLKMAHRTIKHSTSAITNVLLEKASGEFKF
jgi:hypothetical protein